MSKLTPAQFKRLVTDHIPADRIIEMREFWHTSPLGWGNKWKVVNFILHPSVQVRYGNGEVGVIVVQHGFVKYFNHISIEEAAKLGQALIDAAWIAEEVGRKHAS